MTIELIEGDCREVLKDLPSQSVNCIVTSPPYFGLRDYGVENQMGLEPTPAEFVEALVGVMREARRVLRDDGTFWLNLGDSYASAWAMPGGRRNIAGQGSLVSGKRADRPNRLVGGLKEKDLIGIPWRVAFALQADGWYLRQDIIWHKPNPMPESVRDRCTKAHEYIFLLSKSASYYFDCGAMQEPATTERPQRKRALELAAQKGLTEAHIAAIRACGVSDAGKAQYTQSGYLKNAPDVQALANEAKIALGGYYREFLTADDAMRNRRSVWTVGTKPFKEAHFATFPPDLIEPCVLAGCPEGGTVLDPFFGAGTTGVVCQRTNRSCIGIELNPAYYDIASRRLWPEDFVQAAE